MRDKILLRQLQALPLDAKVLMTQQRIREWYDHWFGDVYISFSGGKDSTVLAYLVHDLYPNVPLVFSNTGLEYPEIQKFAREMGAEFVRPKMSFSEVISKYGYPIISKEVAEAIHFARRIVPQNAESLDALEREYKTPQRKRTELDGRRTNELTTRQNRMEESKPYRQDPITQGSSEWKCKGQDRITNYPPPSENQRQQEDGQTSSVNERVTKNRKIQTATHGEVADPG